MESNEDAVLIEQIKQRDPEALATYIDHVRGQLTGFLRSITGDHLLAVIEIDDLIQEVSTAALLGLDTAPLDV